MRAVTSGVSAGSSLAILHHLLGASHSNFDPTLCPDFSIGTDWHWGSFFCGLICGALIFAAIEFLVTLRWAFIQFVSAYTSGTGCFDPEVRRKPLYKILS